MKYKTLYIVATVCIAVSAINLTNLIITEPDPQIINATWNKPKSKIIEDQETNKEILIFNQMTGVMPKYDPQTGKLQVVSTTPPTNQTLDGNNLTTYNQNITKKNGTLLWTIWNDTNNKTQKYVLETEYYTSTWKGATIKTPNNTYTYKNTLEGYKNYVNKALELLPKIQYEITGKLNPIKTIPSLIGIFIGTTGIIYTKIKEEREP